MLALEARQLGEEALAGHAQGERADNTTASMLSRPREALATPAPTVMMYSCAG
jgi:hypothetical protein